MHRDSRDGHVRGAVLVLTITLVAIGGIERIRSEPNASQLTLFVVSTKGHPDDHSQNTDVSDIYSKTAAGSSSSSSSLGENRRLDAYHVIGAIGAFSASFLWRRQNVRAMEILDPERISEALGDMVRTSKSLSASAVASMETHSQSGVRDEDMYSIVSSDSHADTPGKNDRDKGILGFMSKMEKEADAEKEQPNFQIPNPGDPRFKIGNEEAENLIREFRGKSSFHTGLWDFFKMGGWWPNEMAGVRKMHQTVVPIPVLRGAPPNPPPLCLLSHVALPLDPKLVEEADLSQVSQLTKPCISLFVYMPFDLDFQYVQQTTSEKLQLLGIQKIGVLRFHWLDFLDHRYTDAIRRLARLSITNHISLMNFPPSHVKKVIDKLGKKSKVKSVTVQYSLLDTRASGKLTAYCLKHGLTIQAYGALAGGLLTDYWLHKPPLGDVMDPDRASLGRYADMLEEWGSWNLFQQLLRTLRAIGNKHNTSIAMVAMRWTMQQPAVSGVIDDNDHIHSDFFKLNLGVPGTDTRIKSSVSGTPNVTEQIMSIYHRIVELKTKGKFGGINGSSGTSTEVNSDDSDYPKRDPLHESSDADKELKHVNYFKRSEPKDPHVEVEWERKGLTTAAKAVANRREFHERLLRFALDAEDMLKISAVTQKARDLLTALGQCGEEYRPLPSENLQENNG